MTCVDLLWDDSEHSTLFVLNDMTGWIQRIDECDDAVRAVCWLPYARRHEGRIAFRGKRVCVGASSGMVTILDFSKLKHWCQQSDSDSS
jgi:hypothetical protein